MSDAFSIEKFELYHVAGIAEIERVSFSEPWSESAIYNIGSDKASRFIVAMAGGRVAGYAGMMTVLDEGYIANIAVHPDRRRMGLGRAMIRRLADVGQEMGLSFITLEVRASNAAGIALYASEGFRREGIRPGYYTLPDEDGIIMTLRLKGCEGAGG